MTLSKGEPYYIKALLNEYTGGDHLSVAVEIEQTTLANHHHAMKEIQQLGIGIDNNKDTTRITVENADGGLYILNFQDPVKLTYLASEKINTNATAGQMCDALQYKWC